MTQLVEYINPPGAAPAQGLYSHVAKTTGSELYFIAGQLAVDLDGNVVGAGNFEAQFKQVFANLAYTLSSLDLTFNHIVEFTTFFVHSQDIDTFMRLRAEHFPTWFHGSTYAPNTICVIDRLVKEAFLFEVKAIAAR